MPAIRGRELIIAPTHVLKILAAIVWYGGGFLLLVKASSLLREAAGLQPERSWPAIAAVAGFVLGGMKGFFLFRRSCLENLDRIDALERPRIWGFYRPRFFLFLSLMILVGTTFSRLAHGHYSLLIGVGILDLSVATALLTSSYVFWKRPALMKTTER